MAVYKVFHPSRSVSCLCSLVNILKHETIQFIQFFKIKIYFDVDFVYIQYCTKTSEERYSFNDFYLKEIGRKMLEDLPRDSSITRVRNRCAITSRARGIVTRWRLSRIVWRSLADYNKLSGVQRAMW